MSRTELPEKQHTELPVYYYQELEMSLEAVHAKVVGERNDRIARSELVQTALISVIGLVLAFISLLQITDFKIPKPADALIYAARKLLLEPIESVSFIALLIVVYLMFRRVIRPDEWSSAKWLLRILQILRRRYALAIIFTMAFVAGFIAVFFGT